MRGATIKLTTEQKSWALLADGKVKVRYVAGDHAVLDVQGSASIPYSVMFDELRGWTCNCPARVDKCAHILAAKLIVSLRESKTKALSNENVFEMQNS